MKANRSIACLLLAALPARKSQRKRLILSWNCWLRSATS